MDSKSSFDPTACSFEQAREAIRSCLETLTSRKPDFAHVLTTLQPFEDCEDFADANPEHSAALMGIVLATLGDCHRENHDYKKAAELYRRAGNYRPIMGFEEYYAEMVVKQRMEEHYGPALEYLRAAKEDSRRVPILTRIQFFFRNVLSLRFRNPFRSRRLIRELSQLTNR